MVAAFVAWSGFSMRRTSLSATSSSRASWRRDMRTLRNDTKSAAFSAITTGGTTRGRRLVARDGSGRFSPSRIVPAINSRRRSRASASASSLVAPSVAPPPEIRKCDDIPTVFVAFDLGGVVVDIRHWFDSPNSGFDVPRRLRPSKIIAHIFDRNKSLPFTAEPPPIFPGAWCLRCSIGTPATMPAAPPVGASFACSRNPAAHGGTAQSRRTREHMTTRLSIGMIIIMQSRMSIRHWGVQRADMATRPRIVRPMPTALGLHIRQCAAP